MTNKTIALTLTLSVAALCCLADDQRTFFQVGEKIYSATNGWNLATVQGERSVEGEIADTNEDGELITRLVTIHSPMMFKLRTANHEQLIFLFSTSLGGAWTNQAYHITANEQDLKFGKIPHGHLRNSSPNAFAQTNFVVHETRWNPTNGLLTSTAVDFSGGKVRFNSDVP